MEAYLIETLRYHGVTNDQLLEKVECGDTSDWEQLNENFNFNELMLLREQNPTVFEKVLYEGYNIKFLTFNGLKNMLKLKFNKVPEKDFTVTKNGVKHLVMTNEELQTLRQILSSNWVVTNDLEKRIQVELQGDSYNIV